jgi:hypothetical protein
MNTEEIINQAIRQQKDKYPGETLWLLRKVTGKDNASLPSDHWVVGFGQEPAVGERICMTRLANKEYPEGRHGCFESSPVRSFVRNHGADLWVIQTQNSEYVLTRLSSSVFDGFMK